MRGLPRHALAWSPFWAFLLTVAACGDDVVARGRADTGVAGPDGGTSDPLPLQAGMRFAYRAQLNYRTGAAAAENKDAIYELALLITGVDDRGALGQSTVTVTATGARTFQQHWDPTAGVHSWVAGAGPTEDSDQVSPAPTMIALSRPPDPPPIGPNKRLPLDDLFFLDLRQAQGLRAAFFGAFSAIGPRFVAPDEEPHHRWVLGLDGTDPDMEFYPPEVRHRSLSLAYDPRGFLVEIRETLGDTRVPNTPNGSFTLELVHGP